MSPSQIFIYPTDTVWGIGCDIYSEEGYLEIARIKKSNTNKPLSIIFRDVQQIIETFKLPGEFTQNWLESFFLLESTLGIPVKWCNVALPQWAQQNSEYISCRVLTTEPIKTLCKKINNPFFTTSLNRQGDPPILNEAKALDFLTNYCPNAILINGSQSTLSGFASSIIFININNQNLKYDILRAGRKINEIKLHLDLLHFV